MSIEHAPARGGIDVMRRTEILKAFKIGNSTLYNWVAAGTFPRPVHLGPHTAVWLRSEVEAVLRQRAAERPQR